MTDDKTLRRGLGLSPVEAISADDERHYNRHVKAAEKLLTTRACYDEATVHALLAIAAAIKQQAK